ncbi:MAG: zinc-dependent metalloprotease, partial [Saprospiraceae bacterium]
RLIENETLHGNQAYSIVDLFRDMHDGIFSELKNGRPIGTYRRNLQLAFVDKLESLMNLKGAQYEQSDIKAMARGMLITLKGQTGKNVKRQKDTLSKLHLQELHARIEKILGDDD